LRRIVLAVAAAGLLLAGCGHGHGGKAASVTTTPATTPPAPPTTAAPSATTTAKPSVTTPATTSAPAVGAALTGHGAELTPPDAPTSRPRPAGGGDCHALIDPGYQGECGTFDGPRSVWVVEHKGSDQRALVWSGNGKGDQWLLRAREDDPQGDTFSDVKVLVVPLGSGTSAAVFGFRRPGTGDILELDVVDDQGPVKVHLEAEQGSARVVGNQLEVWSAAYGPQDPTCCPSGFTRQVIERRGTQWVRVSQQRVDPATVPASQL
jgi:hypothetical protein